MRDKNYLSHAESPLNKGVSGDDVRDGDNFVNIGITALLVEITSIVTSITNILVAITSIDMKFTINSSKLR